MVKKEKNMSDENVILEEIKPFLEKQEKERDLQDEIEFYGARKRRISFLRDALSIFFEKDVDSIVEVESLWKWLQTNLKQDLSYILDSLDKKQDFLEQFNRDPVWDMESVINGYLDDLEKSLDLLLQKQHRQTWRPKTIQEATETLKSWNAKGVFVALLDKEDKLLEEPYPVTIDPTANVKAT
ncbi:unnamed protein product, partial [marine sediment metagenome]